MKIEDLLQAAVLVGDPMRAFIVVPDVRDEAAFRAWLTGIAKFGQSLTQLTATPIDDKVLSLLVVAVTDDQMWDAMYALIVATLPNEEMPHVAQALPESSPIVQDVFRASVAHPALAGLNLDQIVAFIKMLVEFLSSLKK